MTLRLVNKIFLYSASRALFRKVEVRSRNRCKPWYLPKYATVTQASITRVDALFRSQWASYVKELQIGFDDGKMVLKNMLLGSKNVRTAKEIIRAAIVYLHQMSRLLPFVLHRFQNLRVLRLDGLIYVYGEDTDTPELVPVQRCFALLVKNSLMASRLTHLERLELWLRPEHLDIYRSSSLDNGTSPSEITTGAAEAIEQLRAHFSHAKIFEVYDKDDRTRNWYLQYKAEMRGRQALTTT